MKNNVTYLIGAGASAGKRGEGKIIEGLPCVADIPQRLEYLCSYFRNIEIGTEITTLPESFWDWKELKESRDNLVNDLHELYIQSKQHATIDTYARKLLLTGQRNEFIRLEKLLSLYFIIEQTILPPDSRYDAFFANILADNGEMPEQINVISWNYDSQFEIAYAEYYDSSLYIASKQQMTFTNNAKIIKINGTASFERIKETLPMFRKNILSKLNSLDERDKDLYIAIKLLELYVKTVSKHAPENKTFLSFAFDKDNYPTEKVLERINKIMADTKALVIIGYTFPFFNRQVDRHILQSINSEAHIYIQDKDPERIKQNIEAVLTTNQKEKNHIVLLKNTEQFYLPPEL